MSDKKKFYFWVKKVHLYASMVTIVMLLMYLLTSFMMIYHDTFKPDSHKSTQSLSILPEDISKDHWPNFMEKQHISGRKIKEYTTDAGDLVREYERVGQHQKIVLHQDNQVDITTHIQNVNGLLIGFHRLRGYGGSWPYNVYAFLLDMVGLSLILFALTGVIMWLKLLKFNKWAWGILITGFVYVGAIVCYLIFV